MRFRETPPGGPVIESGTATTPMFPMDPCVVKDAEGYHLFVSSVFAPKDSGLSVSWDFDLPYEGNIFKLVTAIAYAFSSDEGMTWTFRDSPVLVPEGDGWDSFRVETANVIVHDDVLHLLYSADGNRNGQPFTTRYQIGAVSMPLGGRSIRQTFLDDGRTFSRTRSVPILACDTEQQSFRNNVQEPSILRVGDHFELFFIGLRVSEPDMPLGQPGQALVGGGLGRAILDDALAVQDVTEVEIEHPINLIEVRRVNGTYYMFTALPGPTGWSDHNGSIGYLTSDDGLKWSDPVTVLKTDPASSFANWDLKSPTAVVEPDSIVLFYSALAVQDTMDPDRWAAHAGPDRYMSVTIGRAVAAL